MKIAEKYLPFFSSVLLMSLVLYIIYPHYQYYLDPDGVSYLTISQRYAKADFINAVNGYWSPWSCWLTALLISSGLQAIPASVVVNALGAIGFIFISQSFFLRFAIGRPFQWLFNTTLALFLCYAIFWQSFDDIWECFFLLTTLRIMLASDFISKPALWIAMGIVGTLAYFAKAYSFPFFILNTIFCVYFLTGKKLRQSLKISFIAVFTMVALSMPWIFALQDKYGIWTTSTAGTLNMSWYLVGHPQWKDGIGALLPPPYPDSPFYWEDPYLVNGPTPHLWTSWHLFGLQLLRLGLNAHKFLISTLQLSVFFPAIVIAALFSARKSKFGSLFVDSERIIMMSFLLFPAGYALVNYESRYLWYMIPLGMCLFALWLQRRNTIKRGRSLDPLVVLFVISILVYPTWEMYKLWNSGADEYKIARELKRSNIKGTFTAKVKPGPESYRMYRIAYFTGSSFYFTPKQDISHTELLKEMNRYSVNYFFQYGDSPELKNDVFADDRGIPYNGVYKETPGVRGGLKIFTIHPNTKPAEGSYY